MADYFADTSAITKRYLEEDGSQWLSDLCDDKSNVIYIASVTRVEMLAALTRRGKGGLITSAEAAAACLLFRTDLETDYTSVAVDASILDRAADLAEKHALRGYDAIQLSVAIETNVDTIGSGLPPITLLSSDRELNAAALLEGLCIEDPVDHK